MIRTNIILAVLLLLSMQFARADERILAFHSDIHVNRDGSMAVTETITVRSEGREIRRGIYRDFPSLYRDRFGNRYRVDFTVINVERDGRNEPYYSEPVSNGLRTYIGNADVLLEPGIHTYSISYRTNRQLGYFDGHDELYWNVTGNGWSFPIDTASARVYLPADVPTYRVMADAYTGPAGSTGQDFSENRYSGGAVFIETDRVLAKGEGLTIVVSWPKGYVVEPDFTEKLGYFYSDNRHLIIAVAGLAVLLVYYLLVWHTFGRDPESGVIIARYQPPDNYSPASLRFISRMGYDRKCFVAALINLAVKGYLTIVEANDGYHVEKTGQKVSMLAGESALAKRLFAESDRVSIAQENHKLLSTALESHELSLRRDYEKKYFVRNSGYFILGLVLSVTVFAFSIFAMPGPTDSFAAVFILVWLTGWSFGVFFLVNSAIQGWRRVRDGFMVFAALQVTVFALIFAGIEVFVIYLFAGMMQWAMVIVVLLAAGINWLFYELLKRPTLMGRQLLDQVDGFQHYLEVAEKQELEVRHLNGRCPELFETWLPYALALGIEQRWAEKFADVLVKVTADGSDVYRPAWYHGAHWDNHHIGGFSSSLGGSFTQAIAAAATAPGSASGGGGGGSSGGGGGGGGGGGW